MTDDLVKRLRKWDYGKSTWALLEDAADRIEMLERDVLEYSSATADIVFQNEELDRALNRVIDRWEAQKARIETLEASEAEWQPICDSYAAENQRFADRIEKLEAALREIVDVRYFGSEGADMECQEMRQIARKALEGKDA